MYIYRLSQCYISDIDYRSVIFQILIIAVLYFRYRLSCCYISDIDSAVLYFRYRFSQCYISDIDGCTHIDYRSATSQILMGVQILIITVLYFRY